MKVKVYYHVNELEQTMVFSSKEFGILEYYPDGCRLEAKNLKDMIMNSYVGIRKYNDFKKWGRLVYLGEL